MSRLNQRINSLLSPAQNAVLNPVTFSSKRAKVLSLAKTGFYRNGSGILTCTVTVEPAEDLGHPIRIVGLASMAEPVGKLKVGDVVSFVGSLQGSLRFGKSPYVVLSHLGEPEDEQ